MKLSRQIEYVLGGLILLTLGVALSRHSALGTSAISSIPYVVSVASPVSMGLASIGVNCSLVGLQVILLKGKGGISQLLQIPFALCMGILIDVWNRIVEFIPVMNYGMQVGLALFSIFFTALGVTCIVHSELTSGPAEGLALVLSEKLHLPFSKTKTIVDCTLVALAAILSWICLGQIEGIREGTLAAILSVGFISHSMNKWLFQSKKDREHSVFSLLHSHS